MLDRSETKSAVAHVIDVKAHISQKEEDKIIEEGIGEQSNILAFISERRQDPAFRKRYTKLTYIISVMYIDTLSRFSYDSFMAHLCRITTRQGYRWAISTAID